MNMTLRSLVLSVGLLTGLAPIGAGAGYMSLYAFGDSLSDSGNMSNVVWALSGGTVEVPPPPYYQGRASNGPVAVEYLAARLGLTAKPVVDRTGNVDPAGTNFAVLGSATGPVTQANGTVYRNYMTFRYSPLLPDVGIYDQIGAFAFLTGGVADPHALYFLWGGANDAYLALEDPGIDQSNVAQMNAIAGASAQRAANNLGDQILYLASLGARDFLVPNLPDLGQTPDAVLGSLAGVYGRAYAPALSYYTETFNTTLASLLSTLDADPLLRIFEFDVYGLFAAYAGSGLYNTTQPCMLTPSCDPESYLFWDGVHPTTYFQARLGDLMAQAVPAPATLALLLPGLLLMAMARTRATRP
jgi:phospholipase/lecithinase/hemolysin